MAALRRTPKLRLALEPAELATDGGRLPLTLKRHPRARRMILRLDRAGKGVLLIMPAQASRQKALDFARTHAEWIRERLTSSHKRVPFVHGAVIPLRGVPHEIRQCDSLRGVIRATPAAAGLAGRIEVPGGSLHLPRRLFEWLKSECKKDLLLASEAYAKAMAVSFRRITVRDQSSRWGSCSAGGQLSYSWRLILAPSFVLDYVAAHEVAHLVQMNHGPRFWALVARHCPEHQRARAWIKRHGRDLHCYGH